jgi:putative ABC transport system permease protein
MSLGVGLVVAVLVIHGVVNQSFNRSAQGFNLVVGAKGSRLELVLSTIFHIGRAPSSMPYYVYDELANGPKYASEVELAIPICLGDTFKTFRVIGTTVDMFDRLEYTEGKKYEFEEGGRNFEVDRPLEAVVGSVVASKAGLKVGETFRPVHGDRLDKGDEHEPFKVVGILKPTGTPNDRAIFVNIEGFYQMHHSAESEKHAAADKVADKKAAAKPDAEKHDAEKHDAHGKHELTDDQKQISAVLLVTKSNSIQAVALPKQIAKDLEVQAVAPTQEITNLFEGIIGNIQIVLLFLAVLIVIVAGIGILVSIYNSMNDRRHEIAIMRALGARRMTVMVIVLFESILLALGGGLIGLVLGHGLTGALSPLIADQIGVSISPFQFQPGELVLIPGLVLLASVVGFLPAIVAYRTDVAQSLISTP